MYPAEVKLLLTPTREVYLYDENTLRQLNAGMCELANTYYMRSLVIQAQTPEVLANYVYLRMIIQNAPYLVSFLIEFTCVKYVLDSLLLSGPKFLVF
jgi:hypothetical protein